MKNHSFQIPSSIIANLDAAIAGRLSRSEAIVRAVDSALSNPDQVVQALIRRISTGQRHSKDLVRVSIYIPDDFSDNLDLLADILQIHQTSTLRLAIEAYTHGLMETRS